MAWSEKTATARYNANQTARPSSSAMGVWRLLRVTALSALSFTIALSVCIATAHAVTPSPEQKCLLGRAKAAAKYLSCIDTQVGKGDLKGVVNPTKLGKCVKKYWLAYERLQAQASRSPAVETCDAARIVDNGDGTVTDNLTGLQWEKKTTSGIHDKNVFFTWSANGAGLADGTIFTTFLDTLNGTAFAGQHDWRLPTLAELLSITDPAYPDCVGGGPCIVDSATFGPTKTPNFHYTGTGDQVNPGNVWTVGFSNAEASKASKTNNRSVRAVRGGSF